MLTDTDPSLTHTLTTALLPERGAGVGTLPGTEWRKDEQIASQKRRIARQREEIDRLDGVVEKLQEMLRQSREQLAAEEAWNLDTAKRLDALVRGVDLIGMGVTAEELHRLADEARKPRMTFVASPSPASQHAKLVRLVETVEDALKSSEPYATGYTLTPNDRMTDMRSALADLGPIAEDAS